MKRYILYITLVIFGLSACKKESLSKYAIEKSFDDPAIKVEDFKKALAAGTDGFKMIVIPTTSGIIGGYIKFDGTAKAKMLLDNNTANATTPFDHEYTVKVSQLNTVFGLGSTSKFAAFARAKGGIDTTYTYKYTIGDTLKLVGDVLGTKMNLVKTTKADGDEYLAGKMAKVIAEGNKLSSFEKYFKRLTIGSKSYDMSLNTANKIATFTYANGTTFTSVSTAYFYTNNSIEFKSPFIDGSTIIPSINNLVVNVAGNTATFSAGTTSATITNVSAPLIVDLTVARRFKATPPKGTWGESYDGFTISGVTDALGVKTIPDFVSIDFYPVLSGATYGGFRFYTETGYYSLFPAFTSVATTDGRLVFTLLGYAGTSTVTATSNIIARTTTIIAQTQGFYVIPTLSESGGVAYDMVNVKDATSWITFE